MPLYLKVTTDNTSDTVLQCFLEAVESFGLPSRVRCDKGGENVKVSEFMLSHPRRGPGRGSCITSRSVHDQRIERLWRDVFSGCVSLFYNLFYALEDEGLLDVNNETDLFALHYVYVPQLQKQLDITTESEDNTTEAHTSYGFRGCLTWTLTMTPLLELLKPC